MAEGIGPQEGERPQGSPVQELAAGDSPEAG